MSYMWADTLLAAERTCLLRLLVWGVASVVAGTAVVAMLRVRGRQSALLRGFGGVTAAWGAADLLYALWGLHGLALRDVASATRLDRLLWLNIGLDAGLVIAGLMLAIAGWRLGRRLGLVGAGIAVVAQASALALLDLLLATVISR